MPEVGLDSKNELAQKKASWGPGAGSRTRTYEGRSREIYSLLSLPLDDSSNEIIIYDVVDKINYLQFWQNVL